MGEQEKPRIRWVNFTGGLNIQTEPFLLKENEYSDCENMVLDNGVPQTRLGAAKWTATNWSASNYCDTQIKGLGEYLYYNNLGALIRYLLAASNASNGHGNLHLWRNTGTSWAYVGEIYHASTASLWTHFINFKNRMVMLNGTDPPRELDAEFDDDVTYQLGIKNPARIVLISDFPVAAASDDGIVSSNYTYGGAKCVENTSGVTDWSERINDIDRQGNNACLQLSETVINATESETLTFNPVLDLSKFPESSVSAGYITSDEFDYIAFDLDLLGWDLLECLRIYIDFDDGDFDNPYSMLEFSKWYLMNETFWGGYKDGKYKIRIPKNHFDAGRCVGFDTQLTNTEWAKVKAIKLEIKKSGLNATGTTNQVVAQIDYLRLEESPPIPAASGKLIDPMESYSTWQVIGGTAAANNAEHTYGVSSKTIPFAATSFQAIYRNYSPALDLAHWENDVLLRKTDCFAFDVYTTAENITACLISLRFHSGWVSGESGANAGRWIGVSKFCGATQAWGNARNLMPGLLKSKTWQTVYIPVSWVHDTLMTGFTERIGEFIANNWPKQVDGVDCIWYGTKDHEYGTPKWTPEEVLSNVNRISIGMWVAGAGFDVYVDNLRIVPFPVRKSICTFSAARVQFDIPLAGFYDMVQDAFPRFAGLVQAWCELTNTTLPQQINVDRVAGEQWQVTGCANWDFDVENKNSLWSSLRLELDPGNIAVASRSFLIPKNLNEYGSDRTNKRPQWWSAGDTVSHDGYVSDDVDVICLSIMINRITAVEKIQLIFACGTSDYYMYEIVPEDYGYKDGKIYEHMENKSILDVLGTVDVKDAIGFVGSAALDYYIGNTKTPSGDYRAEFVKGDHVWHEIKIPKNKFTRFGDTASADWSTVSNVTFNIFGHPLVGSVVWLDTMFLKNEGALTGEYYYKVIYRTKDNQSVSSHISPKATPKGADIIVWSIPCSGDARVLYKDLYRMGGANSTFRFVATLMDGDTTYYDYKPDKELGAEIDPDYGLPPVAKYGCAHNNRLFLANTKYKPSRLFYSRPFVPGAFPVQNFIDIEPSSYGEITGVAHRDDDLIVFKTNATYRVCEGQQNGQTVYWWISIDKTIGCDAPRSICARNNVVYWIWRNKPYRLVGGTVDDRFGDKIEDLFQYCSGSSVDPIAHTATSAYHKDRIFFSIKSLAASSENDKVITFNTKYGVWEGKQFNISGLSSTTVINSGWHINSMLSLFEGILLGGASKGSAWAASVFSKFDIWQLMKPTTYADNAVAIAAKIRTWFVAGLEKIIEGYRIWVACKKSEGTFSSDTLSIRPVLDYTFDESGEGGAILTVADAHSLSSVTRPQFFDQPVRGQDTGGFLGLEIGCTNDTGRIKVLSAVLEAEKSVDRE